MARGSVDTLLAVLIAMSAYTDKPARRTLLGANKGLACVGCVRAGRLCVTFAQKDRGERLLIDPQPSKWCVDSGWDQASRWIKLQMTNIRRLRSSGTDMVNWLKGLNWFTYRRLPFQRKETRR